MFGDINIGTVALAILVVLILILIVSNIQIVQQSKAYVVERLGAFHAVWGVGLHLKVPFIERVVKKVSSEGAGGGFRPPARHHQGQCYHADRHRHLFSDHRPQALHLWRGVSHERH